MRAVQQRLRLVPAPSGPPDIDRAHGAPAAAVLRQRRHRERLRSGRIVVNIEVDEVALAESWSRLGYLRPFESDDRLAIEAALEKAVGDFAVVLVR